MNEFHLSLSAVEAGLDAVRCSPADTGLLKMIVVRPATGERAVLDECEVSVADSLRGARWSAGSKEAGTEITLMNSRAAGLIAGDRSRWPLAGDQLDVDFDLSEDNLPPGTRIAIGEVMLEITVKDHTGCSKFAKRFGTDALKFDKSAQGAHLNLRGIYARALVGGTVRTGYAIAKISVS